MHAITSTCFCNHGTTPFCPAIRGCKFTGSLFRPSFWCSETLLAWSISYCFASILWLYLLDELWTRHVCAGWNQDNLPSETHSRIPWCQRCWNHCRLHPCYRHIQRHLGTEASRETWTIRWFGQGARFVIRRRLDDVVDWWVQRRALRRLHYQSASHFQRSCRGDEG